MLEPVPNDPKLLLPRISIDGRAPMAAYAAGFDASTLRPRVGVLIAGIGMSDSNSVAAIKTLPGGVTLAISPYAPDMSRLLGVARSNEHEYLVSVPMEPEGYPVNDPDDRRRADDIAAPGREPDPIARDPGAAQRLCRGDECPGLDAWGAFDRHAGSV